jgi:hypothetical protein
MSPDAILERSQQLHQKLLARRLAVAKSRHDAAMVRLRQIIDANHPNGELHPEGWREILQARFVESEALSEYISVLREVETAPQLHVVKH